MKRVALTILMIGGCAAYAQEAPPTDAIITDSVTVDLAMPDIELTETDTPVPVAETAPTINIDEADTGEVPAPEVE